MGGVKKSISKISKGDITGAADLGLQSLSFGQVNTNGFKDGELGGLSNALLGKRDKGTQDRFMALDPLQKKALGKFGVLLDRNTDKMANEMVVRQENQIRQNAADTERQAKQLTAQRGLGNSSVGLNAIINSRRNVGDQIGAVRAQLPGLKYNLETQNLNNATNGIQNILNNRTFIQGREGMGRVGGLMGQGGLVQTLGPSAMQAAGTYYGAQAGLGK